jgi:hypothetical protein
VSVSEQQPDQQSIPLEHGLQKYSVLVRFSHVCPAAVLHWRPQAPQLSASVVSMGTPLQQRAFGSSTFHDVPSARGEGAPQTPSLQVGIPWHASGAGPQGLPFTLAPGEHTLASDSAASRRFAASGQAPPSHAPCGSSSKDTRHPEAHARISAPTEARRARTA